MSDSLQNQQKRVAIVGGGLVGSLNACFFAQRGWIVDLFEAREDIRRSKHAPGRSINLALSTRAKVALEAIGCEDYVYQQGIPMFGRYVHNVDGKSYNLQPYGMNNEVRLTNRRNLNEYLLTKAEQYPNVTIHFQHKLVSCKFERNEIVCDCDGTHETFVADLICGCDGAYSAVRRSFMKIQGFNYSHEYIDHGYLELCIMPNENNEFRMTPNYFHLWPRGQFCLIGLANMDKTFTVTMLAPWSLYQNLNNDESIEKFFGKYFSDALNLIGRDQILAVFHNNQPNSLISVKCSPHHFGDKVILLGDAAHAMVPFYGQGMNCGFEDCLLLKELLDKNNDNTALTLTQYSSMRCTDAHAICDLAMYNYSELKDLVNRFSFRFRKCVDFMLNKLFPNFWMPLYNMVTFSRIRYHEIVKHRASQDRILQLIEKGLFSIAFIGFLFFIVNLKRKLFN